jgi:hypothetical protein
MIFQTSFSDYRSAEKYFSKPIYSIAKNAGVGYAVGDIISRTVVRNALTGAVILPDLWQNEAAQTQLAAAPLIADLTYDTIDVVLSETSLVVSNASVALPAIPATADKASIQVQSNDIFWKGDGSAATAVVGVNTMQNVGGAIYLNSPDEIAKFRAIRMTALDAILNITYFNSVSVNQ